MSKNKIKPALQRFYQPKTKSGHECTSFQCTECHEPLRLSFFHALPPELNRLIVQEAQQATAVIEEEHDEKITTLHANSQYDYAHMTKTYYKSQVVDKLYKKFQYHSDVTYYLYENGQRRFEIHLTSREFTGLAFYSNDDIFNKFVRQVEQFDHEGYITFDTGEETIEFQKKENTIIVAKNQLVSYFPSQVYSTAFKIVLKDMLKRVMAMRTLLQMCQVIATGN